jgi:uncharacterized membrane protein YedE/YeeE
LGLTIILGLAVGVPLGYALQKGGFCMNTAFRSILFEKDKSLIRAYVLVLVINLVGVNLLYELGVINITMAPFFWPALTIGGFVFGVGMVLAGGCTSGTWYRTGKGMLGSFVALLGYAAGATAISVGFLRPMQDALRAPVLDVYGEEATLANVLAPDLWWMRWVVIAVLVVLGVLYLLRSPKQRFVIGWGWTRTGLVVGLLAAVAWVASSLTQRDYGLSFTQPTVSIVRYLLSGDNGGINWATFLVIGVPIGAFAAAKAAGEFALRLPEPRRLLQQFGGGIVMGLGASLAGGCNIGHGITGISTLALSSVMATLFTILGCWAMTWVVYSSEAKKAAAATIEQRRSA